MADKIFEKFYYYRITFLLGQNYILITNSHFLTFRKSLPFLKLLQKMFYLQ